MEVPSAGHAIGLLLGSVAGDGDARVLAVLELLGGASPREVAERWSVEPVQLHHWARAFVEAGASAVTNRPDADAARQRDRYLAAFAHELRTPLAVATGWTALLADGDLGPEDHIATVGRLGAALQRLNERTSDVEQLAAASLGRLDLATELLTSAQVATLAPGAPALLPEDGCVQVVRADPARLSLILRDLWAAASSSPPAPTSVRLALRSVPPWVELRVERRGDPIPPLVLRALFDPFDLNQDDTGVTLGLHLARALAAAHGGTLGLDDSDGVTVLWVRLPAATQGA